YMTAGFNPGKTIIINKILKITILLVIIFRPVTLLEAQQEGTRPKIGLVLSGGGSHGIAHVGVLKVMEEAGLRPDYISGVSMGSIVGGMYAIGYSADSLHKILKQINWNLGFTRIIPENKVIFPEKEHYNNSIISLPISSKKLKLPSGLINGQQIENMFSYYSWPAAGINDFSKLPIPFMCLAVDILTGKIVELRSGYLPDAMRASSAVPTIFTPIRIDSALLIDGGVLRNYAAEEVREMGADIVIGSYTGFQAYSEDQLQSMPGIIKQIAFLRSFADFQAQKKLTDVLIQPDVKKYPSAGFYNVDSLFEEGYKAALPYKKYFKKLADSLNRICPAVDPERILDRQGLKIDKIEITGNKTYSDYQILGVLGIRPGEIIGKNLITEKIDLLFGKTWFEKVKYRLSSRNDSMVLVLDCIEEPESKLFGAFYYDSYIRSGITFRATFKDLISTRSLIDFDSFIGQFYRAKLSMLQYLDRNQKLGFTMCFYTDNTLLPILDMRGDPGSTFNRTFSTRFSVNKYLGLNHLMNLSLNFENS
ncbi:MAG: patatin-like phospholipase family protein, partial [Bacteroidales bacterium]